MQLDESITNEIIKRYNYLYENKELALALCIKKNDEKDQNYYLYSNVDNDIVDSFQEFLLSDKRIETTGLYKYIEFIKENKYFLNIVQNKIDCVEKIRNYNIYLRNIPTFTVWKILNYVRKYNQNNKNIVKALDVYYNLDRYILTGINWKSGYDIVEEDIIENNDKLFLFPAPIIVTRKKCGNKKTFMALMYAGNEYEEEDDFLSLNLNQKEYKENIYYSSFSIILEKMDYLNVEVKKSIFDNLSNLKVKTYKKGF